MLEKAVSWALDNMHKKGIDNPNQHGFIDLVRQYFIDNNVRHKPMTFDDVKPYL